ncbi:MBL fold metallo-hydrolase [Treponema brennaborense]|uniref:MBL fold metallo-hydrolase n=1 Tax=Treponema brennaborense TaxID=81028 RepID=UPI0002E378CF|nr:MBL fold metallo-hydrolase [Treponema brennaborense]
MTTDISVCRTGPLGVNTLIVPLCPGYVFMADPGGDAGLIDSLLKRQAVVPAFIVCTHGHFDHVLGLGELLSRYPGTPVAAGVYETGYFGSEGAERQRADLHALGLDDMIPALADLPPVTVPLADGAALDCAVRPDAPAAVKTAAARWSVLHTPGHSAGGVCLYNAGDALLVAGDTLFYGGYGRTDLYGGDGRALRQSLRRLSLLPGSVRVYPGHGTAAFRLDENVLPAFF